MKNIKILVVAFAILVGVSVFALPEKSDAYWDIGINIGSNGGYYNDDYGYGYGYDDYGYGSSYGGYGYNDYGYSNYGGGYGYASYPSYGGYGYNPMFSKTVYGPSRTSSTISGYPYLNGGYSGTPSDYVSFVGPKFFYPQYSGYGSNCGYGSYYCY